MTTILLHTYTFEDVACNTYTTRLPAHAPASCPARSSHGTPPQPGPLFLLRLGAGVADDHTRNTHARRHTKADLNHSRLYCPFKHDLTYAHPPSCSSTGSIYHLDTHLHPFTPLRIRQSITASRWLNAQVHALSVNIAITSPPPC